MALIIPVHATRPCKTYDSSVHLAIRVQTAVQPYRWNIHRLAHADSNGYAVAGGKTSNGLSTDPTYPAAIRQSRQMVGRRPAIHHRHTTHAAGACLDDHSGARSVGVADRPVNNAIPWKTALTGVSGHTAVGISLAQLDASKT